MKRAKNTNTTLRWLICGVVLAAALLIVVVISTLWVMEKNVLDGTEESLENYDVCIETQYCTLYFPGQWNQYLIIKENDDAIGFYAEVGSVEEQYLFTISFGNMKSDFLGKILTKDEAEVDVYVDIAKIVPETSWNQDEMSIIYAMQEEINYVISNLPFIEVLSGEGEWEVVPSELPVAEYEEMIIEFPYGQLFFPGNWEGQIRVECDEESEVIVKVYGTIGEHNEVEIFRLFFDEISKPNVGVFMTEEGNSFGVNFIVNDVMFDESWSEEEKQMLFSMQEGINYLLSRMALVNIESYDCGEENILEDIVAVEDDIIIETPFVELRYPGKWRNLVRVDHINGDAYTVALYGKVPFGEDMHLFSIRFDDRIESDGEKLIMQDGTVIYVSLIYEELLFEADTDRETMDTIYAMQDDINYLLKELQFE